MKVHSGVDADSGITQSLERSAAKLPDSQVWGGLLHGGATSVWTDKGYVSAEREVAFKAPGKIWGVIRTAPKGGKLHKLDELVNRLVAMVQAEVEYPFGMIKRQLGCVKTRYRSLAGNRAQIFTLFALGNLLLARRRLMTSGRV